MTAATGSMMPDAKWDNPLDKWPASRIESAIESDKLALNKNHLAVQEELKKVSDIRDRRNRLLCEELARQIEKNPSGRNQVKCLHEFRNDDEPSVLLACLQPAIQEMNPDNFRFGQWTFQPAFPPETKLSSEDTTPFHSLLSPLVRAGLDIKHYQNPAQIANDAKRSTALGIFQAQMKGRGFLVEYGKDEQLDQYQVVVSLDA